MKPVAWMDELGDLEKVNHRNEPWTPLYTAPRELSDEEIEGLARANVDGNASMEQLKWFARAILKKANE